MPSCRPALLPSCRLAILPLLLLAACADSSRIGQSDREVPRWHGTADLTIGSLVGEHDQFGRISGITSVSSNGRIFIADANNNTITAFDSTGRYLFDVGQEGSGPGEVKGPCCLAFDNEGNLWVRDAFNSRYNRYAVEENDARFIGYRKMAHGAGGLWTTLTFDSGTRLIDVGHAPFENGRMLMLRFHLDSTRNPGPVDTIYSPPNDSLGMHQFPLNGGAIGFLYQPYGPRLLIAHAPGGGWARALSSRYFVRWSVNGDSASTRTIRRDMIGPALSVRERQEADSSLKAQAERMGQALNSLPFGVPGSKPPIQAIMFDQQGRLWVQLNVGDGENNRADVYDSTGRRVGNAEWPSGVDLRQGFIDDRTAFGIRQDSAGVPQVVRIRFR